MIPAHAHHQRQRDTPVRRQSVAKGEGRFSDSRLLRQLQRCPKAGIFLVGHGAADSEGLLAQLAIDDGIGEAQACHARALRTSAPPRSRPPARRLARPALPTPPSRSADTTRPSRRLRPSITDFYTGTVPRNGRESGLATADCGKGLCAGRCATGQKIGRMLRVAGRIKGDKSNLSGHGNGTYPLLFPRPATSTSLLCSAHPRDENLCRG